MGRGSAFFPFVSELDIHVSITYSSVCACCRSWEQWNRSTELSLHARGIHIHGCGSQLWLETIGKENTVPMLGIYR